MGLQEYFNDDQIITIITHYEFIIVRTMHWDCVIEDWIVHMDFTIIVMDYSVAITIITANAYFIQNN